MKMDLFNVYVCLFLQGTCTFLAEAGRCNKNHPCRDRYLDGKCNKKHLCVTDKAKCYNGKCTCEDGYYETEENCKKRRLRESCSDTTQCEATNAKCSRGGLCKCRSGFFGIERNCHSAAAVYVPVVIIALVLVVVVGVIYIRRKRRDKKNNKRMSTGSVTDNARDRTTVSVSNRAYTDRLDDEIIGSNPQQSGSRDIEYAEIIDVDQSNSGYHAISFKPEEFTVGAGYGHLPKQKHNTDNAYAHTTGNHSAGHRDTTYFHIRDTGVIKQGTDNTAISDNSDPAYNTIQPVDRRGVQHNNAEDNDEYNHTHFPNSTTTTEVADKSLSEGYMSLGTRTATPYEVVEKQGVKNAQVKNSTNSALSEETRISNYEGNATHDSGVQSADDFGHNYFVLQKNDPNIDKQTDTGQNNYFVLEKSN